MSKYFAKYLPVEGEINIGDHFFANEAVRKCVALKEGKYPYQDETGSWHSENWKKSKVQFFLCSRNIKVGDEVQEKDGGEAIASEKTIDFLKRYGAFKVIGPISPEATWVKEGDEFDDSDFKRAWEYVWNRYQEEDIETDLDYYWIKGPCGHFH